MSGNAGYIDYALSSLEQARERVAELKEGGLRAELERAEKTARLLEAGDYYSALREIASTLRGAERLLFLSRVASSGDEKLRRHALRLVNLMLRRARSLRGSAGRRWLLSQRGGRLDIRLTLMRMARFSSRPLVYRRRGRLDKLVLVVDKSGSMSRYAAEAILAASAFAPRVKRLVVFDREARVTDRLATRPERRLLDTLLSLGFSGLTDIVEAVRRAAEGLPPSKMVLISDMEQTVRRREDIVTELVELRRRGWVIHVIAPSIPLGVKRKLIESGVIVHEADLKRLSAVLMRI